MRQWLQCMETDFQFADIFDLYTESIVLSFLFLLQTDMYNFLNS